MEFRLENMDVFSDATSLLNTVCERANMKCSPELFSLIASEPSILPCVIALEIMPQFFTHYLCDQFHHSTISIAHFSMSMVNMKSKGFSSMSLSVVQPQQCGVLIKFQGSPTSEDVKVKEHALRLMAPEDQEEIAQIDYEAFVTMDLEEFKRIILELDDSRGVNVTLTDSQIKFFTRTKTISLTEGKECIIGGVEAGKIIQFKISLYPIDFFSNFLSKRVWLFKTSGSNRLIISAPLGLHLRILAYFRPQRL